MEIRQLITFLSIVQHQSFTKAAAVLGYAQSSVTSQIQLLEEEMGVKLFDRLGKKVSLTTPGESFLPYARQITTLVNEARSVVASTGEMKGTLKIGAPESLCVTRFPELYRRYHEKFPSVEVSLRISDITNLKQLLRENQIDLALVIDDKPAEPDICVYVNQPEPLVLLAAPNHPLCKKGSITLKDLNQENLILTEAGCSYRQGFSELLKREAVVPRSILDSASIQAIKELTFSGMGIAFLPRVAALTELAEGKLCCLAWQSDTIHFNTRLVYHKDKWLSPLFKAFLALSEEFLSSASCS